MFRGEVGSLVPTIDVIILSVCGAWGFGLRDSYWVDVIRRVLKLGVRVVLLCSLFGFHSL